MFDVGSGYGPSIGGGGGSEEATLWVNASTGDDSRSKATVAGSGGSLPWQTIGRAVWGSTNRSAPNASEAAAAGDVVAIAAGTYTSNVQLNDRLGVLYNPVNEGTAGNDITFMAVGNVILGAPALNAGVIGSVAKDYIKWYADRTTGKFLITCDARFGTPVNLSSSSASGGVLTIHTSGAHGLTNGEMVVVRDHNSTPAITASPGTQTTVTVVDSDTFTIADVTYTAGGGAVGTVRKVFDTKADSAVVNTTPDTGPVIFNGCENCWLEGFDIDGGPQTDWIDNYEGVRMEGAIGTTLRNLEIWSFLNGASSVNGTCVMTYDSSGGLYEHLYLHGSGSGMGFKDNPIPAPVDVVDNLVRRCLIEDHTTAGVFFSISAEGANEITECIIRDIDQMGLFITGGDLDDVWVYNMTFVNVPVGTYVSATGHSGVKIWNNIYAGVTTRCIEFDGETCPAATAMSFQHNVYQQDSGSFYLGSDGSRTFASFNAAFTDQHSEDPDAVEDDPEFVNEAGGNYLLQGTSPALSLGRHPLTSATVHAGCYPANTDTSIGLES